MKPEEADAALVHTEHSICDSKRLDDEYKLLRKILRQNSFPTDKIIQEHHKPIWSKQEYMITVVLSYTGPVSFKIETILSKEIKVYYSTSNKPSQRRFTHRDKTEKN